MNKRWLVAVCTAAALAGCSATQAPTPPPPSVHSTPATKPLEYAVNTDLVGGGTQQLVIRMGEPTTAADYLKSRRVHCEWRSEEMAVPFTITFFNTTNINKKIGARLTIAVQTDDEGTPKDFDLLLQTSQDESCRRMQPTRNATNESYDEESAYRGHLDYDIASKEAITPGSLLAASMVLFVRPRGEKLFTPDRLFLRIAAEWPTADRPGYRASKAWASEKGNLVGAITPTAQQKKQKDMAEQSGALYIPMIAGVNPCTKLKMPPSEMTCLRSIELTFTKPLPAAA